MHLQRRHPLVDNAKPELGITNEVVPSLNVLADDRATENTKKLQPDARRRRLQLVTVADDERPAQLRT